MQKKQSFPKSVVSNGSQETVARIEIIKGPHKGNSYKLVGAKISIGRSKKNDLALDRDEKCSRQQAVISFNNSHYMVKDISRRSSLKINDKVQLQSVLQDGDIIQFGSTVLRFSFKLPMAHYKPYPVTGHMPVGAAPVPSPHLKKKEAFAPVTSPPSSMELNKQYLSPKQSQNPPPPKMPGLQMKKIRRKPQKKNSGPKIIMLFLLFIGGYLYLNNDSTQEENTDKLRTVKDIEDNIQTLTELKEKAKEQFDQTNLHDFQNAQFAYIKGIRDYRKGVYVRAIESFRACKTIHPRHELCTSYLKKAQVKQQQLIQAWMTTGKTSREKRRFMACMSSFKNVMTTINNTQDLTYKEAKENYKICSFQHLKGRY